MTSRLFAEKAAWGGRFGLLLGYGLRQWPALLVAWTLAALTAITAALQPWPLKILIDYAVGATPAPAPIRTAFMWLSLEPTRAAMGIAAGALSVVVFSIDSALDFALSRTWTAAGQRMVQQAAADVFERVERLSLSFHSRHAVGDFLSRLTGDTWSVYAVADALLITGSQHALTLLIVGPVAAMLDVRLALVSLVIAPALGCSALVLGRRLKDRARTNRDTQSRLWSFVHQTLAAVPIVQAFATESYNGRQFRKLADAAVLGSQHAIVLRTSYGIVNALSFTMGTAVVLVVGGRRVLDGTLSLGTLVLFLGYLRSLQRAAQGLLTSYEDLKSADASLDRVREVLEADDRVEEPAAAVVLPARSGRDGRAVRFEGVTVGYTADRAVLHEVSFEVAAGETVAIVGPTGAGKSTLLALVPRLADVWRGRVVMDGVDVRQVPLAHLRREIAMVLQAPWLLPLTVAENIAYGRPGASRAEIEAAAVAAQADAFIRRLPAGYDTVVGERGATLSGGEQQRLAIARALLKDAPIVLLDEPTAGLDGATEAQVCAALARLTAGRTTLVSAHRLSVIQRADRVVLLERGRVTAVGTPQELLGASPFFHLWKTGQAAAGVMT